MATSMLKKARTAAQKAATKKWQAAGAAKRKNSANVNRAMKAASKAFPNLSKGAIRFWVKQVHKVK